MHTRRNPASDELTATAYHEAAHATVDALRGDPPPYVRIDSERTGHSGPTADSPFDQIKSLLAGEAAECILTGRAPDWESGSWEDSQRAKRILNGLGYDEEKRSRELRRLYGEAEALLHKSWLCVEYIADLLCKHRRVHGDIIDYIACTGGEERVPEPLMERYYGRM